MQTKFEDLADKAMKFATESGETIKDKLGSLDGSIEWDQVKEIAGDLGEDAAAFVRKYPMQSVLGAAAIGFLLGAALGKKK